MVSKFFVIFSLLFYIFTAQANDSIDESEVLAQRGNGVVTQITFAARADKIPVNVRRAVLRDGKRLQDLINTLLLRAQLASDARDAGFDKGQMIVIRMQLAAEAELADAWVKHYVAMQPAADYEALAREQFALQQDKMLTSPKIDVSHILISNNQRSDEEANALADSIRQQLHLDPESFDKLVIQYSEDPSAASNKGKFTNVQKGDMVKAFEESAFLLKEGEISEPVKTEFGYHIIRLDAHIAPEKISFDEVKDKLIKAQHKKHEDRIMQDYLGSLTSLDVEMTEEALQKLVDEQFGEDYSDSPDGGSEQE